MLHLSRLAYQAQIGELSPEKSQIISTTLLHCATDLAQPLEICRRALEGLGYFDSPAGQEVVTQAYQHPKQQMRESALVAMGHSMNPIWLPFIARELTSEVPALRYEAAKAVGEFADAGQPFISALLPLTEDADTEVCLAAIWALGQVGGPHAERILQRLTLTKDAARAQAAQEALSEVALGELG
jgi:HEAT repeat protein